MKWIKATEETSPHYEKVCCRNIKMPGFWFTAFYDHSKNTYCPVHASNLLYHDPKEIEWLDESPTSIPRQDGEESLRDVATMTQQEWEDNWSYFSAGVGNAVNSGYLGYSDKPKWVLVLENRIQTNTLTFNDGMLLIKMGFNVPGYITPPAVSVAVELEKIIGHIKRNAEKITAHTWKTYKDQILSHIGDAEQLPLNPATNV